MYAEIEYLWIKLLWMKYPIIKSLLIEYIYAFQFQGRTFLQPLLEHQLRA